MVIRFCSVFGFAVTVLLVVALLFPASLLAASPVSRMRPYAGIGVLVLPVSSLVDDEPFGRLRLYDEPGMSRLENIKLAGAPRYEWIFAMDADSLPVIVSARKGEWLKVAYDDAGREGWVKPWWRSKFETWDDFFKGRAVCLLPGLQKRYYQLFGQPGAELLAGVAPYQLFKIISLDNDWALVQDGRNLSGWLRWRDEDGRLLTGLGQGGGASNPK
jgi:hypothetical protein